MGSLPLASLRSPTPSSLPSACVASVERLHRQEAPTSRRATRNVETRTCHGCASVPTHARKIRTNQGVIAPSVCTGACVQLPTLFGVDPIASPDGRVGTKRPAQPYHASLRQLHSALLFCLFQTVQRHETFAEE